MSAFKEALAAFRASGPLSLEDEQHLKRWEDDNRAGEIWEACEEWVLLIPMVVRARRISEGPDKIELNVGEIIEMAEKWKGILRELIIMDSHFIHPKTPEVLRRTADYIEKHQAALNRTA
jgi:hypothetical protein